MVTFTPTEDSKLAGEDGEWVGERIPGIAATAAVLLSHKEGNVGGNEESRWHARLPTHGR